MQLRLTIATEEGSTFNIEVDGTMELENVMALLEAEVRSKLASFIGPEIGNGSCRVESAVGEHSFSPRSQVLMDTVGDDRS